MRGLLMKNVACIPCAASIAPTWNWSASVSSNVSETVVCETGFAPSGCGGWDIPASGPALGGLPGAAVHAPAITKTREWTTRGRMPGDCSGAVPLGGRATAHACGGLARRFVDLVVTAAGAREQHVME